MAKSKTRSQFKYEIDWMAVVVKGGIATLLLMVSIISFFTYNIYVGQQDQNNKTDTLYSNWKDFRFEWMLKRQDYDNKHEDLMNKCKEKAKIDSMQNVEIEKLKAKKVYGGGSFGNTAYKYK